MNEEATSERHEAQGRPMLWWSKWLNKTVVAQFRPESEYVLTTAPGNPVLQEPGPNSPRGYVQFPFREGVLEEVNEDASRIVLLTTDPNPANKHVTMRIVVHPEDILFLTVIEGGVIHEE